MSLSLPVLVLSETGPCFQLCPPGPKDWPPSGEIRGGASTLKCSLLAVIYREKLRLRERERVLWPSFCKRQS